MQTEAINGSGAWEHFMRLAQQARTRNAGLSGNHSIPVASPISSRRIQQQATQAANVESNRGYGAPRQVYPGMASTGRGRILGGTFDAWA